MEQSIGRSMLCKSMKWYVGCDITRRALKLTELHRSFIMSNEHKIQKFHLQL